MTTPTNGSARATITSSASGNGCAGRHACKPRNSTPRARSNPPGRTTSQASPPPKPGAGIRFPEPEAKNNRNARRASPGTREARNRGTPEQRNPGTVETGNRGTGNRGTGNRGTGHRSSEEHGNLENMGRAKPPVTCKSPPMFGGLLHFPAGDFPCRAQNPAHGLRGSLQFLRIRTSIPGVASCAIVSTMSSHTS